MFALPAFGSCSILKDVGFDRSWNIEEQVKKAAPAVIMREHCIGTFSDGMGGSGMHMLFFTKLESTRYLANATAHPDGSITSKTNRIAPITAASSAVTT